MCSRLGDLDAAAQAKQLPMTKKQPAIMFGTFTAHCNTAASVDAGRGVVSVARMAGVMQDEL